MKLSCGFVNENYKAQFGWNDYKVPFEENENYKIKCCKNDYAASQLLLFSDEEMLVAVNEDNCFYKRGPVNTVRVEVDVEGINSENVKVHLVGYMQDDDGQQKTDVLLEKKSIHVEKRVVQPIWIEIKTDDQTEAKMYHAKITVYGKNMFENEVILKELYIEVDVVNFTCKQTKDNLFYLDLWQHNSNIGRKYEVELWSDKHFDIMEKYIESLADLGQKAISVIVSEIPWSGQGSYYDRINPSNLYEYSMVKIVKRKDGSFEYDFSAMNRYINLCMEYGINKEIEVFGLINIWVKDDVGFGKVIEDMDDGLRVRYLEKETKIYKYMRTKNDLKGYLNALEENFTNNGWSEIVRAIADEPADVEKFKLRLNELNEMAPSIKFKVAINHVEFMEEKIDNVVDYCPSLICLADKEEEFKEVKKNITGTISYYVCCAPDRPNTFIKSPLIEARIIPWLAWYFELDGFLRWNYTVWPDDPNKDIRYRPAIWKAGDTNFVYPGKNGNPILSLRYKNLKRGIRDFEIIKEYEMKFGKDKVKQLLKEVFLWKDIKELHESNHKSAEELYELDGVKYNEIINKMIEELLLVK